MTATLPSGIRRPFAIMVGVGMRSGVKKMIIGVVLMAIGAAMLILANHGSV